jgi:membrane protein DedA with SNARE-associated domain
MIFPIAVIEGPIITIIGGFLVNLGILGAFTSYAILVVGDVAGDVMFYFIGKYSQTFSWAKRLTRFFGFTEERERSLQNHFQKHAYKSFLLAKFSQGIGCTVQMAGGMARFPLKKYIWISFIGTIPKAFILMSIGYYMGGSYMKIKEYLDSLGLAILYLVIVVVLYFVLRKFIGNYIESRNSKRNLD